MGKNRVAIAALLRKHGAKTGEELKTAYYRSRKPEPGFHQSKKLA